MKLPPFELERYFAKYEFNTEFLLCSSDCEAMTVAELLSLEEGAESRLRETWLGYTESQGSPSLRLAICDIYETITPDNVLVHTGAEEAIFLFMQAVLEPGDHVIVHWPCYQSLREVAIGLGCEVSDWIGREQNGWAPDLDELKGLVRSNTKLVVLNTPHNPTGWLMPRRDYEALHRFVQERGLLLFSDEVYRESEQDPAQRLPAGCDMGEYAVSLGVMSKTYGLAGLRIGWVATRNEAVLARMAALKDYTTICNSAPSETLAELALHHRQRLIERNAGIIRNNLVAFDRFLEAHPGLFVWVRPEAGSMAFPRLLVGSVDEFCDRLVREAGVLLLPGTVYGDTGNHFRLGLGRRNFIQGLERLVQFLPHWSPSPWTAEAP